MSKYVPIGTYVPEHEAQTLEATGANDNVLSRSLRGGVYGAGSQLLSTGGAVADAVGAEDVGGYLHKQSKGLRDTAALPGNSPRVGSYAQLRDDFSMSNLGEYVGGLVGGSLPITAAGIAGGLATGGAGFVPAMLGAGAATLPFNTGEVVQRQQADPQAMQQGAGARLLDAGIGGASASAVESLVPGLVGRQLMGKGAANLAKESFKQMAGRNAMDIPLEGLTEGTGTAIKQYAANQDKPLDWNEIKEGAIGGAAAGTVFTGLGTAADAAHSIGPKTGEMLNGARTSIRTRLDAARGKAGEKLEAAGNTAPGKKVRGVFDDVSEMVDRGKKKVNDTLDKISRGEELGSPADWLAATTDEAKRRMAEFSDSERVKAVVSAGKEMMDDAGFDAAKRADLADALKNTGDRGSQMAVAAMKKAWDLSKAGAGKIREFTDAVNAEFKAYDRRDVDVESRVVDEPTSASELTRLGHTPADVKAAPAEPAAPTTEPAKMTIKEFSAARKAFIAKAMQDDADLSPEAAREMFNLSQNDGRVGMPKSPEPPKRSEDYSGVHKVIADAIKNNGVVERRPDLFDNDEKIGSVASTLRTLIEKMAKGNVSKGLMNKVSRLFGDDAASILNTVKNTISADLDPGEAEQFFRNMSVMKDIERGERSLHDVMRDSMTDEARTRTQEIEKDADVLKAHARGQLGGSRSEAALSDQMINEYYERNYGENADRVRAAIEQAVKPARGREEGAARMDENGAEVQDSEGGFDDQGRRLEAADRDTQVYGLTRPNVEGQSKSKLDGMAMHKDSQYAKQHMLDLRAKFSGVDANGDYTHEVRFEQLPGSEFGHVVVEKYDNSKEFNESDLKNMELESHEFSKSNSRIEVGGRILDAVKIARTMRGKLQGQFESGPTTAKGRLASGFKHGLSMLTDQFDQRIDVADDVVIGFVSGKKLTWGEAQKLDKRTHADKMNDADAAELFELRKEFRAAKDAGASPEVIQEILDAYKELEGETRAAKNKELGQGEDLQGRSTNRQRPMSVIEARDAVERGKNPSSPARTREDDSVPKQIAVEYDPEDENRFMVIRDNPNGVSKDNDGSFAKDKGGNIHALGDKTGPAFGGNEANRVARAPRGSVVRQDAAQPLVNARTLAKKNEDLTTNDAIVHRSNMDGSGHFVSPSRVPHKNLIAAIAEWDSKASVGAAKLKQRAETLLANFDMMSAADQRKFMTIAPENVKAGRGLPAVDYGSMVDYPEARAEGAVKGKFAPMSVADARSIVNDLAAKYKDRIVEAKGEAIGQPVPSDSRGRTLTVEDSGRGRGELESDESKYRSWLEKNTNEPWTRIKRAEARNRPRPQVEPAVRDAEGRREGETKLRIPAAPEATSIVGGSKRGVVHQRNPVQFYNEGIAGVRGPETKPATQPAAQPKPSINEKLVDKVVLSENYPTTVAGAEKFLNAAKKRFEALKAEDRRVLNDDDHPTQRLPEAEQKVLNALHQTFDKNSDLAPFFTELDGWDAVPEAEQIRLMKFAESLTEGKPDPKPVAAKSAASFGNKASTGRMQAEFPALVLREPTLRERAEITKHRDALAARLGEKMPKVEGFSIRDGAIGNFAGKAVTRGGQHHILLAKELFDDTTPFLGSTQDKVERATLHEIGHLLDRDDGHFSDIAAAFKEGGRVYEELQALTEASTYAHDWYGYAFGTKNPHRELFAQAFSAFHYNPEALKNAAPKTHSFIRNYLQNRDAGGSGQVGRADNAAQLDRPVSAVQEADTAAKKQAFLARAASGDKALLEHLKTSTDAKGLQRALELLNDHEFEGVSESSTTADNVADVYDVLNTRLGELVGGSEDVAYGLQTRKYSLMSTSIHDDLGRGGFAATHDSPIKHEGKFDWRAHKGKGEGNAAFGAGTYLSTADGVHRSYKDQFTAKVEASRPSREAIDKIKAKLQRIREALRIPELAEYRDAIKRGEELPARLEDAYNLMKDEGFMPSFKMIEAAVDVSNWNKLVKQLTEITAAYQKGESSSFRDDKSPTYEVSVDIKPDQLLDWNALLSEQGELVRNAFEKAGFVDNEAKIQKALQRYIDAENDLQAIKKDEQTERKVSAAKDAEYYDSHPFETVEDPSDITLRWAKKKNAANEKIKATRLEWRLIKEQVSSHVFTGGQLYAKLSEHLGSQAAASDYLQSLGVLGHKYAASGGKNDVHPNYVIYDDSKITTNYVHFDKSATNPNKGAGPRRRLSVEQHIEKVLGKSVRVLWQNFSHAGQYTHAYGKGLIELSVHALNPMSTAYHESLHAFFAQLRDAGAVDITNILNKAASSEHVIAQLRERFKNQPAVLTQLKDPEERAAYMYQMWASDPTFKVSIAAKNVFQKIADVIRKALGIWSNDERALHIMEFFHSGDYAKSMSQPNAMRAMIMEPGRNRAVEVAKTLTEPMRQLADAIASSGDARLRDTEIPALVNLADRIKRRDTAEGGDQGFIPAARIATTKRLGDMAAQLEGYSPETLNEALNSLQSGILAPSADAQRAVAAIKAILARTKAYMESAGVELGDLGPDYFPRVWDPHYISKNEQAMLDMLQPYVRSGQFKGNPTEFIRRLTSRDGNEFGVESTKPGMQHAKVRDLAFLKAEDVAPFLNKDLMGTLASYISQAARRAEWERRLGGDKLEALKLAAQGEGATPAQMAMVDDYLKGVDGTLGDQIDPNARRLMGNMIVYQNVRLLPMAMFSMLVDPMGVMVRGGTVTDAWTTFKRGIKSIPVTYGKTDVHDEATKIAELVGVVDNAMLTSVMGDLYTQGMVGGTAKKINNAFFKYNMVEGLNRAFRVGATEAAMKFMERHMNGPQTPNSARWIAELGLRPGDIKMVGGRMALLQSDGLSPRQVTRVHAAINQWVDGSMLRPDAADKPIWMNDPHYALISHLKQFVFTFQKVILGRLVHELRHGNYAPVMALAAYVPIMIAADTAKGVIQGGGDEPEWKKGWGVEEYVGHGIQRAGLFGVGQFGVDALEDAQRGGSGFGALSGPTLEQLADIVQVMGGSKQFESVALRSMPANAVYANWSAEGAPAANLTQ